MWGLRREEDGGNGDGGIPAYADGEGAVGPVAAFGQGHLPAEVGPGPVEDLMAVAVLGGVEGVVGVRVHAVVGVGCHWGRCVCVCADFVLPIGIGGLGCWKE
jgi:hypothetical protein